MEAAKTKEVQQIKKAVSKNKFQRDWKPIATDLAITVAKGFITGFALRLGGNLYDYSFNRSSKVSSLTLIEGGKKVNSI